MQVTTIGLDLAKNVFHVHGITACGEVAFNRALRRAQVLAFFERLDPCLIGIEACSTSHYWARALIRLGHEVKLIPPIYVKPYVKRGKSDAADAAAICEAVTRPTMRFVEIKTPDQQAILALHRTRDLVVRQRTQTVNMLRGQLAEFGIVFPQGVGHATQFAKRMLDGECPDLPEVAGDVVAELCEQLLFLHGKIAGYTREMTRVAQRETRVALLQTIPGVGPITASAIVASGHVRRANRPDTRPHLTNRNHIRNVLLSRSHPHRTNRTSDQNTQMTGPDPLGPSGFAAGFGVAVD
jgi:transposase